VTEFPAHVEDRYRRLAEKRRWPREVEAAFRTSVGWYRALEENPGPRCHYEYVDSEGLLDKGARWLWETVIVNGEVVAGHDRNAQADRAPSGLFECWFCALAKENPNWDYRRIHSELLALDLQIAASTVWQILTNAGIEPAPERSTSTWAQFLRSQADALLACDFFETVTLTRTGTRMYVLVAIEHAHRRIRILGATPHPTAAWVTQAVRNLVMDLEDAGCRARFLIRDRDGKFPQLFDVILADADIV
jgi:hypothetical protein